MAPAGTAALLHRLDEAGVAGPQLWNIAAALHDQLGEKDAARRLSRRVLDAPDAPAEQRLLAATLLVRFGDRGAAGAAEAAYGDLGEPLAETGKLLFVAQRAAAWPLVERLLGRLRAAYAAGNFSEPGEAAHANLFWCDDHASNIGVAREARAPPAGRGRRAAGGGGRRAGAGSASAICPAIFASTPSARLTLGLLRHHDPANVEVTLYCSGWDDGSALRRELAAQVQRVRSVSRLGGAEAAAQIRADRIDVLVEMNGYTRAQRLDILRYQPAPVLIHYLGFAGSLGGGVVDYIVGDKVSLPAGIEDSLPEAPIRLPHTHFINDHRRYRREPPPPRAQLGLPPGALVLGLFNGISKLRGEVWALWMELLRERRAAILWLLDPGPAARANVLAATEAAGVDPRRIIVAPRASNADHLCRLQHCDLMLDPWPYGGHTTTCDALFAGVPVLTVRGGSIASRISASLLLAAGHRELLHPTVDSYRRTALAFLQRAALSRRRARPGARRRPGQPRLRRRCPRPGVRVGLPRGPRARRRRPAAGADHRAGGRHRGVNRLVPEGQALL